ncbi:hypothetical protein [Saccharicrinis aurantiacus]|uniref:hypothetical protein n=1 Tax=Saccharicrinis aurantiacus TaxID=1849719 RepID=UPI002490D7F8|nr:hypothetical protein [Saccharicrinis aurantiacus]
MASLYYDNGEPKYQKFYNKVSDKPFDKPMYMRLVSETYPFPWIELPNDEELADPNKNVVYYDWVRAYKLVDAIAANETEVTLEQEINLYYEDIMFKSVELNVKSSKNISIPLSYKANEKRNIHFLLKDADGKKVADATYEAHAGYANLEFNFNTITKLEPGKSYTLIAHIRPLKSTRKEALNASAIVLNVQ